LPGVEISAGGRRHRSYRRGAFLKNSLTLCRGCGCVFFSPGRAEAGGGENSMAEARSGSGAAFRLLVQALNGCARYLAVCLFRDGLLRVSSYQTLTGRAASLPRGLRAGAGPDTRFARPGRAPFASPLVARRLSPLCR